MPDKKKKVTDQSTGARISQAASNLGSSFFKSDNKKYPYLGSRFQFDAKVFNPMKNQGPTQRGYTYSVQDATNTSRVGSDTHYNEAKFKQDQSLKNYFGGNKAQRKSAEKGAQRASQISSDYLKSTYKASKLLSEGKASEADDLAYEARKKAFDEQKRGGFGSSEVSRRQYKTIQKISDAYYGPRIAQLAKNMKQDAIPLSTDLAPKVDYKEMNASLRRLVSNKK